MTNEYYQNNKEKIIADVTRWRNNNKDKVAKYTKAYYENNKEKVKNAQTKYRKENPLKYLYSLAKRRAKSRGTEFNIELSDLSLPTHCPYLGIPLDSFHPEQKYHPSIDRINSALGYVKGNVEIISHRANMLKNNASSEELLLIGLRLKGDIT